MKIYGKIIDETGEPLPGANVSMEAYSEINTVTDNDGSFILENDKITIISPIKITYLGYKPQFITSSKLVGKTITMVEDVVNLDDAIVYNNYKKPIPSDMPLSNKAVDHFKKYATPYTVALSLLIITIGVYLIKKAE